MKKYNTRSILLLLLVITSLSSYIFLNTATTNPPNPVIEIEETAGQQIFLPDIEFVKKLVEVGKTVLIRSTE